MTKRLRFITVLLVFACVIVAIGIGAKNARSKNHPFVGPRYQTAMLRWQPNSLAQVISATTTVKSFIKGVIVINAGNTPITEVQIGWAMEVERNGASQTVKTFSTQPTATYIPPGKIGLIQFHNWGTADVLQYALDQGIDRFTARVALIGNKSSDGKSYKYDLDGIGKLPDSSPNAEVENAYDKINKDEIDQFNKQLGDVSINEIKKENHLASNSPLNSPFRPATFKVNSLVSPKSTMPISDSNNQQQSFCCKNNTVQNPCSTASGKTICSVTMNGTMCSVTFCGPNTCCLTNCACQSCAVVPDCILMQQHLYPHRSQIQA